MVRKPASRHATSVASAARTERLVSEPNLERRVAGGERPERGEARGAPRLVTRERAGLDAVLPSPRRVARIAREQHLPRSRQARLDDLPRLRAELACHPARTRRRRPLGGRSRGRLTRPRAPRPAHRRRGRSSAEEKERRLAEGSALSRVRWSKGDGSRRLHVRGSVRVNINDHGIAVPSYLGGTVKPDVDVELSFDAND